MDGIELISELARTKYAGSLGIRSGLEEPVLEAASRFAAKKRPEGRRCPEEAVPPNGFASVTR